MCHLIITSGIASRHAESPQHFYTVALREIACYNIQCEKWFLIQNIVALFFSPGTKQKSLSVSNRSAVFIRKELIHHPIFFSRDCSRDGDPRLPLRRNKFLVTRRSWREFGWFGRLWRASSGVRPATPPACENYFRVLCTGSAMQVARAEFSFYSGTIKQIQSADAARSRRNSPDRVRIVVNYKKGGLNCNEQRRVHANAAK